MSLSSLWAAGVREAGQRSLRRRLSRTLPGAWEQPRSFGRPRVSKGCRGEIYFQDTWGCVIYACDSVGSARGDQMDGKPRAPSWRRQSCWRELSTKSPQVPVKGAARWGPRLFLGSLKTRGTARVRKHPVLLPPPTPPSSALLIFSPSIVSIL